MQGIQLTIFRIIQASRELNPKLPYVTTQTILEETRKTSLATFESEKFQPYHL